MSETPALDGLPVLNPRQRQTAVKPEPRTRTKGRKDRAEAKVKQSIRQQCVERDGDCRMAAARFDDDLPRELYPHRCTTQAEWAHLRGHRRSQTRGQAPERRHTTQHSLMFCQALHALEEAGRLTVTYLSDRGCDGPLRFTLMSTRIIG